MAITALTNQQTATVPAVVANRQLGLSQDMLTMLRKAITEAGKSPEKDIVALIGNTGTGKSTAVNDLTGNRVIYDPDLQAMRVEQGEGIATIGHGSISQTLYTHVYGQNPIPNTTLVLADAGGFMETRGPEHEIAVATSLKLTLENARSVRLILCCETHNIVTDRGIHFAQFLQTAFGKLMRDYRACPRSAMVMLTKPPAFEEKTRPPIPYTHATAIRILSKAQQELAPGSELRALYDYVLRENGRYVSVYDPTDPDMKQRVLQTLQNMEGIENPRGHFRTAYSAGVQLKLIEVMTEISLHGTYLYRTFFQHRLDIERQRQEVNRLQERIKRIREALRVIGEGTGDPELIRRNMEAIQAEQEAIIREQMENIRQCADSETEAEASSKATHERLNLLNREGEQEEEYWKDGIHQKGINIVSITTSTTRESSSGFFGLTSDSSTTVNETKTNDQRPTIRDFYYKGPTIARVVFEPPLETVTSESEPYWSRLTPPTPQGSDTFSIHYQTAKGEDANADITVFVQKKYVPMTLIREGQHHQELRGHAEQLRRLSDEKRGYERIIAEAERRKDAKGNTIERVAQYTANLNELEGEITRVNADIAALEAQNQTIQGELRLSEENFAFLRQYLQLSQDQGLAQVEAVREFLTLDAQFRNPT